MRDNADSQLEQLNALARQMVYCLWTAMPAEYREENLSKMLRDAIADLQANPPEFDFKSPDLELPVDAFERFAPPLPDLSDESTA